MNRVLHDIGTAVTALSLAIGAGCTKGPTDNLKSNTNHTVHAALVGKTYQGVVAQEGDQVYCQFGAEEKTCQLVSSNGDTVTGWNEGTVIAGGYN